MKKVFKGVIALVVLATGIVMTMLIVVSAVISKFDITE